MPDLNRTLLKLFRSSDGLLLPNETVIDEISKKHELKFWNEDIVLQALITMKEPLQELAVRDQIDFVNLWDDTDWGFKIVREISILRLYGSWHGIYQIGQLFLFHPPER